MQKSIIHICIYAYMQKLIFKSNILKNLIYKNIPIINLAKDTISCIATCIKESQISKRVPYS